MHKENIDSARVFLYNLLSLLFVEEHAKHQSALILENLEILAANSFDEDVSDAAKSIVAYLKNDTSKDFYTEYQKLFLVPFGEYVSLSASWYYEEREGGAMLLKVREILAKTKIRKDEHSFKAPEDHYGFIFTLATYLIEQQIKGELEDDLQKELFRSVINPYCDQIAYKLISSDTNVYNNVGAILGNFCNFERAYLDVSKVKE
jgi:TorA maturation chaperone TorD